MIIKVKLNDSLPIFAPLGGGEPNKFLRGIVKDQFNNIVATVTLKNNNDGSYQDRTVPKIPGDMTVKIEVFKDLLFTIPTLKYGPKFHLFQDIPILVIPSKIQVRVKGQEIIKIKIKGQEIIKIKIKGQEIIKIKIKGQESIKIKVRKSDIIRVIVKE